MNDRNSDNSVGLVEIAAKAICNRRNTGQCAAICLSYSSLLPTCPAVKIVWGEDAKAALKAIKEYWSKNFDNCNSLLQEIELILKEEKE